MRPHAHSWKPSPRTASSFDCACGARKLIRTEPDGGTTTEISYPESEDDRVAGEFRRLHDELVPAKGQARTVQGELVRAIAKLTDEYFKEGNANWDAHYRSLVRFLRGHLLDAETFDRKTRHKIEADLDTIVALAGPSPADELDEDAFARLQGHVVKWVRKHPRPQPKARDPKLKR